MEENEKKECGPVHKFKHSGDIVLSDRTECCDKSYGELLEGRDPAQKLWKSIDISDGEDKTVLSLSQWVRANESHLMKDNLRIQIYSVNSFDFLQDCDRKILAIINIDGVEKFFFKRTDEFINSVSKDFQFAYFNGIKGVFFEDCYVMELKENIELKKSVDFWKGQYEKMMSLCENVQNKWQESLNKKMETQEEIEKLRIEKKDLLKLAMEPSYFTKCTIEDLKKENDRLKEDNVQWKENYKLLHEQFIERSQMYSEEVLKTKKLREENKKLQHEYSLLNMGIISNEKPFLFDIYGKTGKFCIRTSNIINNKFGDVELNIFAVEMKK